MQNKDYNHLKCGDIIKGMMVEETLSSVNKPKVSEECIMTFCYCYVLLWATETCTYIPE
jgi:hypothetical protein